MPAFVLFWPAVVWLFMAVATLLTMGGATAARNVTVLLQPSGMVAMI